MNRDYIITYYELGSDKVDQKRFHTLKQLSDWINSDDTAVAITGIDEVPGLKINDKYYRGSQKGGATVWKDSSTINYI